MKRETITQALGGLDDRFVSEAAVYAPRGRCRKARKGSYA